MSVSVHLCCYQCQHLSSCISMVPSHISHLNRHILNFWGGGSDFLFFSAVESVLGCYTDMEMDMGDCVVPGSNSGQQHESKCLNLCSFSPSFLSPLSSPPCPGLIFRRAACSVSIDRTDTPPRGGKAPPFLCSSIQDPFDSHRKSLT